MDQGGLYKDETYGLDVSPRPEDQKDILQCRNCDYVSEDTDPDTKCWLCGDEGDMRLTKSDAVISGRVNLVIPIE